jgi:isocitrate lyase
MNDKIYVDDLVYLIIVTAKSISRDRLYSICLRISNRMSALNSVFQIREGYSEAIEQALSNLLVSNMIYFRSDKPDIYYDAATK